MKHLITLIFIAATLSSCGKREPAQAKKVTGYSACQIQVESGLRDASSAEWPSIRTTLDRFTTIKDGAGLSADISVDGYVDARNGFGGMARQRFFCAVRCSNDSVGSCYVIDFEFL